MSDSCNCIDIKAKVMMDEPKIGGKLDFDGEVIFASDGEDYKCGYDEGHAQGLIDGRKDGYQNGYDEGHKVGYSSGHHAGKLEGLAEGYDNGYAQGKADGYKDGYDEGYSKGYSEGYEQGYSKKVDYIPYVSSIVFSSAISEITDDIYLDLPNATTIQESFRGRTLNCEKVTVKVSNKCTTFRWAFGGILANENLKTIEILGDTSSVTDFSNAFRNRKNLENIIGNFDCSSVTNFGDMLMNVNTIKGFFPKAGTIKASMYLGQPSLTDESIDAIVNGYADMTGQTAPVLTVHSTVKAKIVADDEKDDTDPTKRFWLRTLTNKNVTLA